ncbi:14429_t:CDS:1, partial [Racocetra persica]
GKTLLEIFRENKNKIPYCRSYETMIRIYNDLQQENEKEKEGF